MWFSCVLGRVDNPNSGLFSHSGSGSGSRSVAGLLGAGLLVLGLISFASAQDAFPTSHGNNARTGANTNEVLLAPGNIDKNNFGRLFSYPLDYQSLAQPLYVPNVNIPSKGTHNVVYVATMADTVYAFDAESNAGPNASPLWKVNFTDPANGITTASGPFLPCATTEDRGPGFTQEGIVATPVIDTTTNTMYVVAKILDNGTVRHQLHALDIATGQDKPGSPVTISATVTSNAGRVVNFNSLHQKNRPGLLLLNGIVYLAFGSNYCNDGNHSWVLGYDATTLQQTGVFNTNPDHGLTSIWQAGGGLAADDQYLYPVTSEGNFDVDVGGQGYTHTVLKLSRDLELVDFFIPGSVTYLNDHDLDLSGCSPVILPDQDGPFPHVIVVTGKQGVIYVLNRDTLGRYAPNDSQIIQELVGVLGSMRGAPAYWNGRVYFSAKADRMKVFSVSGGMLSATPIAQTSLILTGAHAPSISANGNSNGIVWVFNGGDLYAYDAISLKMLYNSNQMARDNLPKLSHFVTQTVINGRVYMATRTTLEVFGLRHFMSLAAGGNQSAVVKTALPTPIQVQAVQAYTNAPFPGATITFSDGGKGGVFNPASAVTDNSGIVTTNYTLPQKAGTFTLTASSAGFGNLTTTATALPGAPTLITPSSGNQQYGLPGSVLPLPITARVLDAYKNGVPGITVTFDDGGKGGILTPTSAVTDASGKAKTTYQLPNVVGKVIVKASSSGVKTINFAEHAVAAANVVVVSGNSQSAAAGSQLPQALVVKVTDNLGNPVSGVAVTFDDVGAGGAFSNGNVVTTGSTGTASEFYTLPATPGPVSITASAAGVANPALFSETAQ